MTVPPSVLAAALDAWRAAIGAPYVAAAGEALQAAGEATFATAARPTALLQPASADEVAACLRIAHRHRVPLYPVSGGRNWGYGSRVPPRDGCVLLSLARLDRIVEHHEDLAYVTVEPGVTFRALAAWLRERGSRLLPPLTGTTPDASVVGNVLERGIGKGPYQAMEERACGYEAVLADGRVVRTGFSGVPGARAGALRAAGPGPSPRGLFAQGGPGVVTRLTLWLDPVPAWRQRLVFRLHDAAALAAGVDALREALQRGTGMQVELMNDYRFLAQSRQFPFHEADASAPLPRSWVADALPWAAGARWIGVATAWGESRAEVQLRADGLAARLRAAAGAVHAEPPEPGWDAAPAYDGVRSAYWRKRAPMPAVPDPDRDRCGVVWLTPVLPMLGADAAAVLDAVEAVMLAHGFEPALALRAGPRALQAVVALLYDRDQPDADERAVRCHAALRALLDARGLYPYRLGLLDLAVPPPADPGSAALVAAVRRWADPHGILSPGRFPTA